MLQSHLEMLVTWFDGYSRTFLDTDEEGVRNIRLKIEHTRRVCDVMALLTAGERLDDNESRIAAATALLHDVGRFPQYRRWRTFRDSESDNHARLSVEVIREQRLLQGLEAAEVQLIEEAVRFHNLLVVPDRLASPTSRFVRLIRDADKLDIWHVFTEQEQLPEQERATAAYLGLPDRPEITPVCLEAIRSGAVVRLQECRVVNDIRLMLLSWALDLEFPTSYGLLLQRGYLLQLAALLTGPCDVSGVLAGLQAEVVRRSGGSTLPLPVGD